MIITLDLDDQLCKKLDAAAKARGLSFRGLIRDCLEQAVTVQYDTAFRSRFVQRTHDFGAHLEAPWTTLVEMEMEQYVRAFAKK